MSGNSATNDFWFCGVLFYLGYELVSITRIEPSPRCNFVTTCPELDFKNLRDDYDKGQLAISDVRAFVDICNRIRAIQKEMNRHDETYWLAPDWINERLRRKPLVVGA